MKPRDAMIFSAVVVGATIVASWPRGQPAACRGSDDDPEGAARAFLCEVDQGRCDEAHARFAPSARERVERETDERFRRCFQELPFDAMRPGTVRLEWHEGQRATVFADRMESDPSSYLFPGGCATRSRAVPERVHLVRIDGVWQVDLL